MCVRERKVKVWRAEGGLVHQYCCTAVPLNALEFEVDVTEVIASKQGNTCKESTAPVRLPARTTASNRCCTTPPQSSWRCGVSTSSFSQQYGGAAAAVWSWCWVRLSLSLSPVRRSRSIEGGSPGCAPPWGYLVRTWRKTILLLLIVDFAAVAPSYSRSDWAV